MGSLPKVLFGAVELWPASSIFQYVQPAEFGGRFAISGQLWPRVGVWAGIKRDEALSRWAGPEPYIKSRFNESIIKNIFSIIHPIKIVLDNLIGTYCQLA
jgi:hypothetical protein